MINCHFTANSDQEHNILKFLQTKIVFNQADNINNYVYYNVYFQSQIHSFLTQQTVNYRLSFFEIPVSGLTDDIGSVQIHLGLPGLSWIFLPFSRSSWAFLYVSDDIGYNDQKMNYLVNILQSCLYEDFKMRMERIKNIKIQVGFLKKE